MDPTTISSWALIVAKTLDDYGVDSTAVFKQSGLNPAHLHDPNARYPFSAMTRLWEIAVERTADPCFGLSTVQHWHPTTLHAFGYAWLASHTLKEAFERTERYVHIVSNATSVSLTEKTEGYEFRLIPAQHADHAPAYAALDASMAMIVFMCRLSCGENFSPLQVALQRPAPACSEKLSNFFKTNILYNSDHNQFLFDKHSLEKSLPTANAELVQMNEKIISDYLANLDHDDIVMQIKAKLTDNLTSGNLTEQHMAKLLNISQRSLQRKLAKRGIRYNTLLDETRHQLAEQYLKNSRISIGEVTYLLGFSETSNFSRAFKRWTGLSPRHYRESAISL